MTCERVPVVIAGTLHYMSLEQAAASLSLWWPAQRDCLHHPTSCHHKDPRTFERQSQPRPSPAPFRYVYIELTRQHPSPPRYSCAHTRIEPPRPATAPQLSRPPTSDSSSNPYGSHPRAQLLAPALTVLWSKFLFLTLLVSHNDPVRNLVAIPGVHSAREQARPGRARLGSFRKMCLFARTKRRETA